MRWTLTLVLAAAVLATAAPVEAAIILVDWAGGGDYTAIQPALEAAANSDTVQIAPGTYTGADNRNLTFGPGKNLVIESEGGLGTVTIDCQGQDRAFYLHSTGQSRNTVIRGLVFRNGYTDNYNGGAIILSGTDPVIEYCIFEDCVASHNGGAISVGYTGTDPGPIIRQCVFLRNTATYRAGALTIDNAACQVNNCLFVDNWTTLSTHDSNGGGAVNINGAESSADYVVSLSSCTFVRNSTAGRGAAIMGWSSATASIYACIVAFHEGTALAVDGRDPFSSITYSCFYWNTGGDFTGSYPTVLVGDPLFCDYYSDDFTICEDSPAYALNNPWTIPMGSEDVGCYSPCSSAVEESSWGRIKALYAPNDD